MHEVPTRRSPAMIVEAGELLQSMTPIRLAILSRLTNESTDSQQEIAASMDLSASAVSQHLSVLAGGSRPIINRDGSLPVLTATGSKLLDNIYQLLRLDGVDVETTAWTDDEIVSRLDPICVANGPLFTLVYYAIGVRNSSGERMDLLSFPNTVSVSTVVSDVRAFQEQRGASVSRGKVRYRLKKLADAAVLDYETSAVTLTEKGKLQLRLFERVIQLFEPETEERSDRPQGTTVSLETGSDEPSVVPALCDPDGTPIATGSLTVGELTEIAARQVQAYDDDTELSLSLVIEPSDSSPLN